ncbi:hypothetical protein R83H12_02793 [Fibrobacteria bacterium R8-3-H12]
MLYSGALGFAMVSPLSIQDHPADFSSKYITDKLGYLSLSYIKASRFPLSESSVLGLELLMYSSGIGAFPIVTVVTTLSLS